MDIVKIDHCVWIQGKKWTKLKKMTKKNPSFVPDFGPNLGCQSFFFNLASPVTIYHGQLKSCTISKSTNDPILRKLSYGRIDGQTDESDLIGRCRLMWSVQNLMALVNHALCSKKIEIIALILLHFWNKLMLEKMFS